MVRATGLLWNRLIVAVIGVFLLFYGLWYPLKGDLWTYLGVTGTIYLASMSVLLIACCYWKRANSWGAAAAIVVSAAIPTTYLVMEQSSTAQWRGDRAVLLGNRDLRALRAAMVIGSLMKPGAQESSLAPGVRPAGAARRSFSEGGSV